VTVINGQTNTVIATFPVSYGADERAVNEQTNTVTSDAWFGVNTREIFEWTAAFSAVGILAVSLRFPAIAGCCAGRRRG
jgi:hypothetical protein